MKHIIWAILQKVWNSYRVTGATENNLNLSTMHKLIELLMNSFGNIFILLKILITFYIDNFF